MSEGSPAESVGDADYSGDEDFEKSPKSEARPISSEAKAFVNNLMESSEEDLDEYFSQQASMQSGGEDGEARPRSGSSAYDDDRSYSPASSPSYADPSPQASDEEPESPQAIGVGVSPRSRQSEKYSEDPDYGDTYGAGDSDWEEDSAGNSPLPRRPGSAESGLLEASARGLSGVVQDPAEAGDFAAAEVLISSFDVQRYVSCLWDRGWKLTQPLQPATKDLTGPPDNDYMSWEEAQAAELQADSYDDFEAGIPSKEPVSDPYDEAFEDDDDGAAEVAAIIAASRAAMDIERPGAASSGKEGEEGPLVSNAGPGRPNTRRPQELAQWEQKPLAEKVSTASRDAVEHGPIGSPPPDGDACSGPGWVRDAGVQCGGSAVRSFVAGEVPRQNSQSTFSPARTGGWPAARADSGWSSVSTQTDLSGNARGTTRQNRSDELRLSITSSAPLDPVEEGDRDELDVDTPTKQPRRPPGVAPNRPVPHGYGGYRAGYGESSYMRPLPMAPEQQVMYSSLSHAPVGGLAFSRRLHGRRPTPPGFDTAGAWAQPPWSAREARETQKMRQQVSELPAPVLAGHLHRLCDPFVKQGRRVWLKGMARANSPAGKASQAYPPSPPNTVTKRSRAKKSVAAAAIKFYSKAHTSHLESLGAGGHYPPSGRRF